MRPANLPSYWTHEGGGLVMMRCWGCGHFEAPVDAPQRCPKCGARRRWVFDHLAQPELSMVVVEEAV